MKEKVHPGRCAQRSCEGLTWPLALHYGTDSRWQFSTCLWGWKQKKKPSPRISPASACCWRWCACPLQSLRQVMDDCAHSKDVSVGGVTGASHKHDQWPELNVGYYSSQKDMVYNEFQHLKFSSLTESFVHSLNISLQRIKGFSYGVSTVIIIR